MKRVICVTSFTDLKKSHTSACVSLYTRFKHKCTCRRRFRGSNLCVICSFCIMINLLEDSYGRRTGHYAMVSLWYKSLFTCTTTRFCVPDFRMTKGYIKEKSLQVVIILLIKRQNDCTAKKPYFLRFLLFLSSPAISITYHAFPLFKVRVFTSDFKVWISVNKY